MLANLLLLTSKRSFQILNFTHALKILKLETLENVPTEAELKQAYRSRSFETHPDRKIQNQMEDEDDNNFQNIKLAYEYCLEHRERQEKLNHYDSEQLKNFYKHNKTFDQEKMRKEFAFRAASTRDKDAKFKGRRAVTRRLEKSKQNAMKSIGGSDNFEYDSVAKFEKENRAKKRFIPIDIELKGKTDQFQKENVLHVEHLDKIKLREQNAKTSRYAKNSTAYSRAGGFKLDRERPTRSTGSWQNPIDSVLRDRDRSNRNRFAGMINQQTGELKLEYLYHDFRDSSEFEEIVEQEKAAYQLDRDQYWEYRRKKPPDKK